MALKTALVVDDSRLARITLLKQLEKREMQVHMAESAEQALAFLENDRPDIIFMDHMMPSMDGFEATRRIKANPKTADIPVIMCTGKEEDGYLEEAMAIGAAHILSKPPQASALDVVLDVGIREVPAPVAAAVKAPIAAVPAIDEDALIDKTLQLVWQQLPAQLEGPLGQQKSDQDELVQRQLKPYEALHKQIEGRIGELEQGAKSALTAVELVENSALQASMTDRAEAVWAEHSQELKSAVQKSVTVQLQKYAKASTAMAAESLSDSLLSNLRDNWQSDIQSSVSDQLSAATAGFVNETTLDKRVADVALQSARQLLADAVPTAMSAEMEGAQAKWRELADDWQEEREQLKTQIATLKVLAFSAIGLAAAAIACSFLL